MEVWIKPELIIDEMVLSQVYAANCGDWERKWTISCYTNKPEQHTNNERNHAGEAWFDIDENVSFDQMKSVYESLHNSGYTPKHHTYSGPTATNELRQVNASM